jgi:hypothetical protein
MTSFDAPGLLNSEKWNRSENYITLCRLGAFWCMHYGSYSQESISMDMDQIRQRVPMAKFYHIPWHFHAAKTLKSENSKQDIHHFQFARADTESNATIAMAEPVQLASIHVCTLWWLEWCEIVFSLLNCINFDFAKVFLMKCLSNKCKWFDEKRNSAEIELHCHARGLTLSRTTTFSVIIITANPSRQVFHDSQILFERTCYEIVCEISMSVLYMGGLKSTVFVGWRHHCIENQYCYEAFCNFLSLQDKSHFVQKDAYAWVLWKWQARKHNRLQTPCFILYNEVHGMP